MKHRTPRSQTRPLAAAWFHQPAPVVARALIGNTLVLRGCGGMVVETEAYTPDDPASHSFPGRTARNAAMFGPAGCAYVYRSYGIHLCLNVTCGAGHAVLIRAIVPQLGVPAMAARRGMDRPRLLASGPGRLGQALGITPDDNHHPFDRPDFGFLPGTGGQIIAGPRIGITRATERLWRFGLKGSRFLSRPLHATDTPPPAPSSCEK
ncbi:MAG: DNA-3-methyladenine glycosylase, partial [Pararhodobacter sp.]|nr:DNA-3-methyladenine glycosylase [Pararhodobacter sp.]